jgi:hypothetical protein
VRELSGYFTTPQGCTDIDAFCIFNNNAEPLECHSKGEFSVTVFRNKGGDPCGNGDEYSSSCGWLAGRCVTKLNDAFIYPLGEAMNGDSCAVKVYKV